MNCCKIFIDNDLRLGRGLVFHICPSNVPTNFIYLCSHNIRTSIHICNDFKKWAKKKSDSPKRKAAALWMLMVDERYVDH